MHVPDGERRQREHEKQLKRDAVAKLRERTKEARDAGKFATTAPGRMMLATALPMVAEWLEAGWKKVSTAPGPGHAEVTKALRGADLETVALVGIHTLFNVLSTDTKVALTYAAASIGSSVEMELRMQWFKKHYKGEYEFVKKRDCHRSTSKKHREEKMSRELGKLSLELPPKWTAVTRVRVGAWVVDAIALTTGWLSHELEHTSSKRMQHNLVVEPAMLKVLEAAMERAESLAFVRRPMLCEPAGWHQDETGAWVGGSLESTIYECPLVRAGNSKVSRDPGPVAIEAINRLQKVAYRFNRFIYDVAETLSEARIGQVGAGPPGKCFFVGDPLPVPTERYEGDDFKELRAHKSRKREIYDYNAQLRKGNIKTRQLLWTASKYIDETFYVPWSFDYRGRMYPLLTNLSPQGIDFEKSLFYFADEGPVNHDWLAFQVATTYGLDKAAFGDRIAWAKENAALISEIAEHPLETLSTWSNVSEPWCFLAACKEYHDCCVAKTKTTSGLPVGIDATCSGLQHLSAMTFDASAAALVNVTPADTIADGYKTVAEAAKKYLPEFAHSWMTRKLTKRTVMTVPYGVTLHSARGYIREQLLADNRKLVPGLLTEIVSAVYTKAMPEVFKGPINVMHWVQKTATEAVKAGKDHLSWRSPSGFEVVQDLRIPNTKPISTELFGTARLRLRVVFEELGPDRTRHRAAAAPNLVHSCDAALMHFVLSDVDYPAWGIHDCLLARSCDIDALAYSVRLHFAEMYKGRDILADWARQVGAEPNPDLIIGDLDIESVMDSTYFFS